MPSVEQEYVDNLLAIIRRHPGIKIVDAAPLAQQTFQVAYHAFKSLRERGWIARHNDGWIETQRSRNRAEAL